MMGSLAAQTLRDFEVIVVDQNEDARLAHVMEQYRERMNVRVIRSAPGLSRARNTGLPHCAGEILGFPDDDCWYPPHLLETVSRNFDARPDIGFLTGRWQYADGRDAFGRWPARGRYVSVDHVWTRAISFTIFLRRQAAERIGPFDEQLGVGAGTPWGAGEETDYLLRALECGIRGWHDPACIVYHPDPVPTVNERTLARALSYGRGTGYVLRKHASSPRMILRALGRPLAGAALAAAMLRWPLARQRLLVLKGRWVGLTHRPHSGD